MGFEILPFAPGHAPGVAAIAAELGWPSLVDPTVVTAIFTAPGVSAAVAVSAGEVVGFAQALGDGLVVSYLSFLAVRASHRRLGIARALTREVFVATGTRRMDLLATPESAEFYASFPHHRLDGYRIYPTHT